MQNEIAEISKNQIAVIPSESRPDYLTVSCPAGWDDVKKISRKILVFRGQNYAFTGWNSDRNEAYYRVSENIAVIK